MLCFEQIQLLAERGGESRRIDDGTAVSDESDLGRSV